MVYQCRELFPEILGYHAADLMLICCHDFSLHARGFLTAIAFKRIDRKMTKSPFRFPPPNKDKAWWDFCFLLFSILAIKSRNGHYSEKSSSKRLVSSSPSQATVIRGRWIALWIEKPLSKGLNSLAFHGQRLLPASRGPASLLRSSNRSGNLWKRRSFVTVAVMRETLLPLNWVFQRRQWAREEKVGRGNACGAIERERNRRERERRMRGEMIYKEIMSEVAVLTSEL
jgi:hypothetical protein